MRSSSKWQAAERLVLLAYLLLWPPFLVLASRRSVDPHVFGVWSWRLFAVLSAYALLLITASAIVVLIRRNARFRIAVYGLLLRLRGHRVLHAAAVVLPISGYVLLIAALRWIGVVPGIGVVLCLLDGLLLVLTWVALLAIAGLPHRRQVEFGKKAALAAATTLFTLLAIELSAALLGIGTYADWQINPRRLDVQFKTDDFDTRVVTNRQGLREPREIPPRHAGVYRVLVIGDSMTFGWGVDDEQSYPRVAARTLRDRFDLDDFEIINMGRPGAGPHDYLKYIRHYAGHLHPDLIVIGFLVGNDCPVQAPADLRDAESVSAALSEHIAASRQSVAERLLLRSFLIRLCYAGLASPNRSAGDQMGEPGPVFGEPNPLAPSSLESDIAELADPVSARRRRDHLRREGWLEKGLKWEVNPWLIRAIILNPAGAADSLAVRPETRDAMRHEWKLCEGLLREARRATDALDADLMVLAIPNAHLVSQRWVEFLEARGCVVSAAMTESRVVNDWLADFCRREGIPCVDPLARFRERQRAGDSLYLQTDDHMTPQGYALLGQALAEALAPILAARTEKPQTPP